MAKKIWMLILAIMLMLISCQVMAEELKTPTNAFGGGGPRLGFMNLDLDSLNARLKAEGFDPLDKNIILYGGSGTAGAHGIAFGGWGFAGDVVSTKGNKQACLTTNFTGFHPERYIKFGPLTLSLGVMVGGGSAELTLYDGTATDLDSAVKNRYETTLTANGMVIGPTLSARVKFASFIHLQAGAGYIYTTAREWKHRDHVLSGLPAIPNGTFFTIGMVFGGP